ncbi:MAG: carbon starvation protein A [Thermodesulfobacterium geofontis]|uniref:Carbon starvation protein A n=1 Tax=Thermodesulfobacterium geofontis TaxID=1295609 RepID=A0A2N7Q5Z4_9BACT|nr:MAG: carbon starvation protein A [Thermodesulfobacterium geofontis]
MLKILFFLILIIFGLGYLFYGKFLEKSYGVKEDEKVPSKTNFDGIDFVPTNKFILLGHHFSSIAGAGPIVGPIIAGIAYGWLPGILWIVLGTIFIGGLHDFSSLIASIRNKGKSIGEVAKIYMGESVYKIFLLFIWFSLVYVIAVFTDLAATTFAKEPPVAQVNVGYILIALIFGLSLYKLKIRLPLATLFFLFLIGIIIIFSLKNSFIFLTREAWIWILIIYCFFASILPVWILLQPRDYLSSFLLYSILVIGILGVFFGDYTISYPVFLSFNSQIGPFFPFLFITIACGAISGFHSLVSSGTTSKQLDNIKNAKFVAYGGMVLEGIVATIALITVMIISENLAKSVKLPTDIFSFGISKFVALIGIDPKIGLIYGYLVISAFILTTLDTATRISRYVLQELMNLPISDFRARVFTTLATLILPVILLHLKFYAPDGTLIPAWKIIWPLFGSTNQLLAALVLLTIYVWARNTKPGRYIFILIPTIFMLITTLSALIYLVLGKFKLDIITLIGFILIILAFYMIIAGAKVFGFNR